MPGGHLGTIWASVALDVAPLGAGAARARRMLYAIDASVSKAGAGMSAKMGHALMAVGKTAALAAGLVGATAVKMAADFDKPMREVWSLTKTSEAQFNEWSKEVLDLSKKFPQPAKDIAKALYWVKSYMPDASDAKQFATLEVALKGAVGGVAELEDATKAVAQAQNAYLGTAQDLGEPIKYMDIMNETVKRGALTLQEFAANMGKATGTAAIAGVSFGELSAAVATLTRKGVPVDTAFMALNQTMMSFLKPSAKALRVSKELGIDMSLTGLKAKGLAGALMEIAQKVPDDELTSLFPNIRALKAVFPLVGNAAGEFAEDLALIGDASGTTQAMFGRNMKSMENQLKVMANNIRKPLIELGTKIFPYLQKGLSKIVRIFEGKNATFNAFAGAIKAVGGALWDVGSAVVSVKPLLIGLIGILATAKIYGFVAGIQGIIPALIGLGSAIGSSQIGVAIGLIAAKLAPLASILGTVALPATAAAGAFALLAYETKLHADELDAGFRAQRKYDEELGKAAVAAAPLLENIKKLRDEYKQMADKDTPEAIAKLEELKIAEEGLADAYPGAIAGLSKEGEVRLKNLDVLEREINLRKKLMGVTTEGKPGEMEMLIKDRQKLNNAYDDTMSKIQQLVDWVGKETNAQDKGIQVYDAFMSSYDKGKAILQAQVAQGLISKDTYLKMMPVIEQLGLSYYELGGSMDEASKKMAEMDAQLNNMKSAMLEAAQQSGALGQGLTKETINALKSTIPEINQFGRNLVAQTALGMLEAQGVTGDAAVVLAQTIANKIATGEEGNTGNAAGDAVLRDLQASLGDDGEVVAAASKVGSDIAAAVKAAIIAGDIASTIMSVVSGAVAGLALNPIKLFLDLVPRVNPEFPTVRAAAEYVNKELSRNLSSQRIALNIQEDLGVTFADLTSTGLVGWAKDFANLNREGGVAKTTFEAMEISIFKLTEGSWAAVGAWRAMRDQLDMANAEMKTTETSIKNLQKHISNLQKVQTALNKSVQEWQNRLNYLSQMKIFGETAANEQAYNLQVESNKLQLAIMEAENAYNYELAAQLTLQKDAIDRQKEMLDLSNQITFDPLHRQLENMLDPMYGVEDSFAAIAHEITFAQGKLDEEQTALNTVTAEIEVQNETLSAMQEQWQLNQEAVQNYQSQVDEMAQQFLQHYREMVQASEELARTQQAAAGGGAIMHSGGPVGATGWAYLQAGEFVLSRSMVRQMRDTPKFPNLNLTNSNSTTVQVPIYLDSRKIAEATTRVTGQRASQLHRSGARY